ncbi:MAG: beta-galactosidase [Armatimonadetes bacterium]|nr:beta-galactosidase [Armatimonadota bacterium]MDE2206518.1 beta-galactosidase [Armatimonadota bacterium]
MSKSFALLSALFAALVTGAPTAGNQASGVAVWRAGELGGGLNLLSGADGVASLHRVGNMRVVEPDAGANSSRYLYFQTAEANRFSSSAPVWVTVTYTDLTPGAPIGLEYDSVDGATVTGKYRPAEGQAGGWRSGSGKFLRVEFRLNRFAARHAQNLGADFRLDGLQLAVHSVRLSGRQPTDWSRLERTFPPAMPTETRIGSGKQLIVGGFDPQSFADARSAAQQLAVAAPGMKALGVTSHEVYVRWNLCEPAPGKWDWSVYDRYVRIYKRTGLKWVPFLICGSAYSLPDWYYHSAKSQGYVCLEHHKASDVQSLWNPYFRHLVRTFVQAFLRHYAGSGVIESVLLGISGNYGEAIYPVSGNDWTADVHGHYHTHPGFWAGDPYAMRSFRAWLRRRYRTITAISAAWHAPIASFQRIVPFLRANAPDQRAWLDLMDWYIGSMTDYVRFWLQSVREVYPHGDVYVCTGGDAAPEHGSDFGQQAKAAAEFHAGIRITNEGSNYRDNFSYTRWVASACRQYGAYFSFEPAGGVDAGGVVARIYNAAASGALGLHYYYGNLFGSAEAHANFVRYAPEFRSRGPLLSIGLYYPETWIRLHHNDFLGIAQNLRSYTDYAFASDGQITDGALSRLRVLLLPKAGVMERSILDRIVQWVRAGGILIVPAGLEPIATPDGTVISSVLQECEARPGAGRVAKLPIAGNDPNFGGAAAHWLEEHRMPDPATVEMLEAASSDLFGTRCSRHQSVWYNAGVAPQTVHHRIVPAGGIATINWP